MAVMNLLGSKDESKYIKFRRLLIFYINIVIRSLVSLAFATIFSYLVLNLIFHIQGVTLFIVIFVISIILSPLLFFLNFGETILVKYEAWLDSLIKKDKKYVNEKN